MNAPLSSRTFSNNQTSYEKLALRLTPGTHTQSGIIRISAKGTPTTNSDGFNSTLYNRITRHDNNNHSLPAKTSITSLKTSLSKDNNNVNGRLIRSEVTTSTRNWQAQCGVLKQTLDYYKNRMIELQNKHPTNKNLNQNDKQSSTFKKILQETQLRMSEQNAYLRDCMAKLNDQLQQTKQTIPWLQSNITRLEGLNNILSKDLKQKQNNLVEVEKAYQSLVQQVHDQKYFGQNVNNKLFQLQYHIKNIQQQNKKLRQQLSEHKNNNLNLETFVEEQRAKNKLILQDCLSMQNQVSTHKQHIYQLQDTVNKLKQENNKIKKSEQNYSKKSLFQTKSVRLINKSFEIEHQSHNSCIFRQNRSLTDSLEFKRSYSTAVVQEINGYQQFDNKTFEQKTEEFRLLKTYFNIQNTNSSQSFSQILTIGQYFKEFVSYLLADKSRLQSTIQKYKKIVQINWQNPSIVTQAKSQQFVTDLIDKCNLYQSSLCQKKNTIKYLQHELQSLKKQYKVTPRELKQKYSYLDRQDQIQKQKIIMTKLQKEVNTLSKQLIQPHPDQQTVSSLNSSSKSLHGLDKIKSFKVIASSAKKQQKEKLKNISGQEIFKKMETKLKFYEGEVVPELEAKVSQYKGMLDSFERQISNQSYIDESLQQSRIKAVLNTQRVPANSSLKRRRNINSVIFDDCKQYSMKQIQISKSQTTELSITKQKKKRFDELNAQISTKLLAAVTLRLCQIAQKMIKNQNNTVILPESIYLINYSDQYVGSLKVKILETPKNRQLQIRKYWAPQNIKGASFDELSLVWNLGILIDQLIHGELFFKSQEQIIDMKLFYNCLVVDKPFFKSLLQKMLQKDSNKRILLKHIQTQILQEQQSLFN